MGQCAMYWNYCVESSILESVNNSVLPSTGRSNFLNQIRTLSVLKCSLMSSFKNLMRSGHPHDHHVVHIYQFIAWTGSRPSEPLKLLWKDVDFSKGIYTKRKTKSGQSPTLPMGNMTRQILEAQRRLLDTCPEIMRNSPLVFPGPSGGERRLDSTSDIFSESVTLPEFQSITVRITACAIRWEPRCF